jgi:hypothetical protein
LLLHAEGLVHHEQLAHAARAQVVDSSSTSATGRDAWNPSVDITQNVHGNGQPQSVSIVAKRSERANEKW